MWSRVVPLGDFWEDTRTVFLIMASFLSRFFGTAKTAAQKPSATGHGGWIGYYGLSEWYEELSDEEKDLLRDANQQGLGLDGDNLTAGEVSGSSKTRSGWLNVIATNIQRQNPVLAEKLLAQSIAEAKPIDIYFALGAQAKVLWHEKKVAEAIATATQQLDWYRDEKNRCALQRAVRCLPKVIHGLDVLISASEPAQALQLVMEFAPLLDPENDYQKRIRSLETRALRTQAEQALAAGDKQRAIAIYEEALAKNPHAGVKGVLKKLRS